jgi:2'-5' RNA ligase
MTDRQPQQDTRLRLFVAIDLPEEWKQALSQLQGEMQAALTTDAATSSVRVRWVRPEGLHLTLKFLGEVPRDRLSSIESALTSAVPEPPGFVVTIGRTGSFSDRRAPRVVWAGIQLRDDPQQRALFALEERVETWLASAGFPRERRGSQPHLTLGRLPESMSPQTREAVARITNAFATPEVAPFSVKRVHLMRSHLGPGGSRYERLSEYPA